MELYFLSVIFTFGLIIGSFLNVVIFKLECQRAKEDEIDLKKKTKRINLNGRSFCPNCKHNLSFLDLIPVLSWIFLQGKCRYCKEKISIQYPLVELGAGFIFVLTLFLFPEFFDVLNYAANLSLIPHLLSLLIMLIVNCLLLIVFVYDLKHKIIPDKIIFPAIIVAICYLLFVGIGDLLMANNSLKAVLLGYGATALLSALGAGGFFYLIAAISDGKWMGGGDIKLAFLMGLLLGWPNILVGLTLGFVLGSIIGISLLVLEKADRKAEIPFGPFLITGTWIALFYGQEIVQLYLRTLGF